MTTISGTPEPTRPSRIPLFPLTLIFSALASFSNGTIGHGVFFVMTNEHSFSDLQNLAFAIALYGPYVPAALLAGKLVRRFGDRRMLLFAIAGMTACNVVLTFDQSLVTCWLAAPLYNMFQGAQWPIVESYVTAGRHGRAMRRAIGVWNIVWSSTIIFGLWLVSWFLDDPRVIFGALMLLHVLTFIIALPWPKRIPHHDVEIAATHQGKEYPQLLQSCQTLLFWGYVLAYALSPLLPGVWSRLEVPLDRGAVWTSTWLAARLLPFGIMFVFPVWHGRWRIVLLSGVLLAGGFTTIMVAPTVSLAVVGLIAFGLGHATTYYAAIYYRLSVGHAQVESSGVHEAMIGLGYTIGPATALLGTVVSRSNETGILTSVGAVTLIAIIIASRPYISVLHSRRRAES